MIPAALYPCPVFWETDLPSAGQSACPGVGLGSRRTMPHRCDHKGVDSIAHCQFYWPFGGQILLVLRRRIVMTSAVVRWQSMLAFVVALAACANQESAKVCSFQGQTYLCPGDTECATSQML